MAHFIKLPSFTDSKGGLTVIEKILPFSVKRIYYIYGVPADAIRGGHRHQKNNQALICVSGKCLIKNNNGLKKEEFWLDSPSKCLIVENRDWHEMLHFSPDAVLLVLAEEFYDINDYIDEKYPNH